MGGLCKVAPRCDHPDSARWWLGGRAEPQEETHIQPESDTCREAERRAAGSCCSASSAAGLRPLGFIHPKIPAELWHNKSTSLGATEGDTNPTLAASAPSLQEGSTLPRAGSGNESCVPRILPEAPSPAAGVVPPGTGSPGSGLLVHSKGNELSFHRQHSQLHHPAML